MPPTFFQLFSVPFITFSSFYIILKVDILFFTAVFDFEIKKGQCLASIENEGFKFFLCCKISKEEYQKIEKKV